MKHFWLIEYFLPVCGNYYHLLMKHCLHILITWYWCLTLHKLSIVCVYKIMVMWIRIVIFAGFPPMTMCAIMWKPCLIGCTYMASPRMCFWMSYKSSIPLKNLSHCLHWYSLSQCCVNIWSLRINCCECDLSHPLYFYDLSLICALKCILKSLFFKNISLLWIHWYGFSLICVGMWSLRHLLVVNSLSH